MTQWQRDVLEETARAGKFVLYLLRERYTEQAVRQSRNAARFGLAYHMGIASELGQERERDIIVRFGEEAQ